MNRARGSSIIAFKGFPSCVLIAVLACLVHSPSCLSALVVGSRNRIGSSSTSNLSFQAPTPHQHWRHAQCRCFLSTTISFGSTPGSNTRSWAVCSVPRDSDQHELSSVDDEDDNDRPKPYGNRSLQWTERYRRVLPYERARQIAMSLGLRGKEDWDDHLEDGIVFRGPYLPTRPDEMYAEDWVSWDEFLGVMREYDDARRIVRHVLRLETMDEYRAFVAADAKRAEGLRIPAMPDVVYEGRGWVDEDHFFNRS